MGKRAGGLVALACLLLTAAQAASARPITLAGLTFSDELGGVVLHDGWGTGTAADPFVLVEEINEDGPAVLIVRGMRSRLGDAPDARFQQGIVLRKIVTNATTRGWHAFELELRETLERTSTYEDGLSFGQATRQQRPFTADRYGQRADDRRAFGHGGVQRRAGAAGRGGDGDGGDHRLHAAGRVLPPAAPREPDRRLARPARRDSSDWRAPTGLAWARVATAAGRVLIGRRQDSEPGGSRQTTREQM